MRLTAYAIAIGATVLLAGPAVAYTVDDRSPPFEHLLDTAPLVVVGTVVELLDTSSKEFKNAEEPFVEVYTHYLIKTEQVLKGHLDDPEFTIRTLGGQKGNFRTEPVSTFEPGARMLMVLHPDVGIDPATGRPRDGFLIMYDAKYPIEEETVIVPGERGEQQKLTLPAIAEQIDRLEHQKAERRSRGEPAYARVGTSSGGEGFDQEIEPPARLDTRTERPITTPRDARPLDSKEPGRQ